MILLEKLLSGLQVGVETFAICLVDRGEVLPVEPLDLPAVHYSLAGTGRLRVRGGPSIPFKRHSFIVIPADCSIVIEEASAGPEGAQRGAVCDRLEDVYPRFQHDELEPRVVMACGRIAATYHRAVGLFDHMTEPLVDDFACDDGVCRPFESLLAELAHPQPGSQVLVDSLMQQCLVLLLRRHCASGECRLPWLNALEDPRLSKVIATILDDPQQDFTLEQLADLAGMSRSAFTGHFAKAFERTPIEFVKETRLRRAAVLLRHTDLPIKVVASRVGYSSRSYFSRAFKAYFDVDPLAYRRAAH